MLELQVLEGAVTRQRAGEGRRARRGELGAAELQLLHRRLREGLREGLDTLGHLGEDTRGARIPEGRRSQEGGIADLGGGSLEQPRQWLGAQWAGLSPGGADTGPA